MHRTQTYTLVFAVAAVVVTALSTALAYQGVQEAFERAFSRRLLQFANLAVSQMIVRDVEQAALQGADSDAYLALEAQLEPMTSGAAVADLAILDANRHTIYDRNDAGTRVGEISPFDSLAHAALGRALAGHTLNAPPYAVHGVAMRAVFVPIRDGARTVAVLAMAASPDWAGELVRLQRRLFVVALVSVLAIFILAGILMRQAGKQVQLERQLSRSENLAAMGRLTATLAHEIKNPLAIIRGSARRLAKLEPEAQRMADSVVEEVDRLTRTVGRYLQFARSTPEPNGTGDATGALTATLDLLEGEFIQRRCNLIREGDFSRAPVALDDESLKQVYLNLVLNALEAIGEGGTVQVSVAREGPQLRVEVLDDGPGIPADILKRVGEPFQTTKAQGTGLGLFLCRRLVQSAGGALEVDSPQGGGARVRVRFPQRG